jgi:hypothetical protein
MASRTGKKFHPNSLLVLREFLAPRGDVVLLEAADHIAKDGAEAPIINVHLVCLGMPIQLRALLERLLVLARILKDSVSVTWTFWLICLR